EQGGIARASRCAGSVLPRAARVGTGGALALQTRCVVTAAVSGQPERAHPRANIQGGGWPSGIRKSKNYQRPRQPRGSQPQEDPGVRCAGLGTRTVSRWLLADAYIWARREAASRTGVRSERNSKNHAAAKTNHRTASTA